MSERSLNEIQLTSQDESDVLDLAFLWKIIQMKRWFIFTATAIAFTISAIYSLQLPTVYSARAKILVEKIDQSAFQNPEILKPQPEWGTVYYQTRAELLQSRHILEQAAEQINLGEHYKKVYHDRRLTDEQAVRILSRLTDAKILRGTQIIELTVTDTNPEWAARIANAVSENFLKESLRERLFISDQLLKWFPEEGEALKKSSPISQLKMLEKEDAITSLPSVLHDPVINSIKQDRLRVDTEIKELSGRYTPEHPRMKELLARAGYLESEMKAQIQKIISGLKSGLAGEFGVSNVKVVESAVVPSLPSGPKRARVIFICTVLSLLGSIIFSTLLHHLDQNIRSEEDVRKIPMTFLGYLPMITALDRSSQNGRSQNLLDYILSNPGLVDEVANIRTSVSFSMPAERSKLLMCTSAVPEEGKTTIASMLGISLAEAGEKVLLIDADMRKPSLHRVFSLENKVGLSNCLVGSAHTKDAIRTIERIPGLYVMTAGEKTPNPTILLGSATLTHLIQELESGYSKIIFDVPPSLHIADGLVLTGKIHGTILVFNAGRIHRSVGRKMKERIKSSGGVIIGSVINRANYKNLDYSYYRYYREYRKYYHAPHHPKIEEASSTRSVLTP